MDELLREARRGRTTTRSTSAVCDRRARGRRNDAEAEPRPASVADQSAASVGGATVRPASGERHITDDVHCADAASKEHFFMCPALRKISSAARDNGGSSRRSSWSNTALWCSTSVATEGRSKHPHVCAPTNINRSWLSAGKRDHRADRRYAPSTIRSGNSTQVRTAQVAIRPGTARTSRSGSDFCRRLLSVAATPVPLKLTPR